MRRTLIGWPALAGAGLLALTACGGSRDAADAGRPTAGAGPTTTLHPPAPGVPGTPGPGTVPAPAPIPPGRAPGGGP